MESRCTAPASYLANLTQLSSQELFSSSETDSKIAATAPPLFRLMDGLEEEKLAHEPASLDLKEMNSLLHCYLSTESLLLPSGKTYSLHAFVEHPLFKYTIEKYNVFAFLTFFVQDPSFQQQYGDFLNHIRLENWFEPYLSNPKGLANLSLIAFLEGPISQEDLFVIHMVASAIQESSYQRPAEFTVLKKESAQEHLAAAHYPPFDTSFFSIAKTKDELREAKETVLSNLENKSPIQRTSITYYIDAFSVEYGIFNAFHRLGYHKMNGSDCQRVTILSPFLCLELYEITSSLKKPPPSDHTWMFGLSYNKRILHALKKGRPISIASPLFSIPYVHRYDRGKQLGITLHDVLYHLALDWHNPHCRLFIRLGETLLAAPHQDKSIKELGIACLDRECAIYRQNHNFTNCFWRALANLIAEQTREPSPQVFPLLQKAIPFELLDLSTISAILKDYEDRTCESSSERLALRCKIYFLKKMVYSLSQPFLI